MNKALLSTGNWGSGELQLYYSLSHLFMFNRYIWVLLVHQLQPWWHSWVQAEGSTRVLEPDRPGFKSWLHHFTHLFIHSTHSLLPSVIHSFTRSTSIFLGNILFEFYFYYCHWVYTFLNLIFLNIVIHSHCSKPRKY